MLNRVGDVSYNCFNTQSAYGGCECALFGNENVVGIAFHVDERRTAGHKVLAWCARTADFLNERGQPSDEEPVLQGSF
jgi:hypothetical protein